MTILTSDKHHTSLPEIKSLISYFQTLDNGDGTIRNNAASTQGLSKYLKETGQMFDFAALKATLFNTVLNAGISFVASMIIQGVATAIDKYVNLSLTKPNLCSVI